MNSSVDYLNNPWRPAPQRIIKDRVLSETIDQDGFALRDLLNVEQVTQLNSVFNELHDIHQEDGGMFYSVYSQDLNYRKQIHDRIGSILSSTLKEHFKDYRVMINSFVVKASGKKSEFYVHQDTTGLDESKFSPLNLWIPLTDVSQNNGCLGVIPRSHRMFSPYRSISFPAPFDQISETVRKYIRPLPMQKGQVLVFDNRLVHNSYLNLSGNTRVAVVCGLFPQNAKLTTCHKPKYELGGKVELIEHNDDFLLTHPNFLINCESRPDTGISLGWVDDNYHAITPDGFETLCSKLGVSVYAESDVLPMGQCNLISEPV